MTDTQNTTCQYCEREHGTHACIECCTPLGRKSCEEHGGYCADCLFLMHG